MAADGTHPHRTNADLFQEEAQKSRCLFDRNVHVLNDALGMPVEQVVDRRSQPDPVVPAHDLLIGDGVQQPTAEDEAHGQVLHVEILRAPEPIRVPAPEIVTDGEIVLTAPLDGAVVDLQPGVVARVGCGIRETPESQVHLVVSEDGTVDEIRIPLANLGHCGEVVFRIRIPDMLEGDVGLHRHGFGGELQDIAERSVGVGDTEEQICVIVVRGAVDDLAPG